MSSRSEKGRGRQGDAAVRLLGETAARGGRRLRATDPRVVRSAKAQIEDIVEAPC